ncbi:MAG: NusG domain II-containing protein [Candidatus Cloacimonetes bacterium]|nr:NusG domain II-containing protein [Candidatus Cloacimonadota bacterium]
MASGSFNYRASLKLLNLRDILLILLIIIISIFLFSLDLKRGKSNYVQVKLADKIINSYSLQQDRKVFINEGTILEIKNGKYRLEKSGCPEQICVKMGWCSTQPIICVPQKLVIEPVTKKEKNIITY